VSLSQSTNACPNPGDELLNADDKSLLRAMKDEPARVVAHIRAQQCQIEWLERKLRQVTLEASMEQSTSQGVDPKGRTHNLTALVRPTSVETVAETRSGGTAPAPAATLASGQTWDSPLVCAAMQTACRDSVQASDSMQENWGGSLLGGTSGSWTAAPAVSLASRFHCSAEPMHGNLVQHGEDSWANLKIPARPDDQLLGPASAETVACSSTMTVAYLSATTVARSSLGDSLVGSTSGSWTAVPADSPAWWSALKTGMHATPCNATQRKKCNT
jgi:hypothetical protein